MECTRKVFFKFYPSEKRTPKNEFGDKLRRTFAILIFGHFVFYMISLAYIGFTPMFENLILGLFCYSTYLTLAKKAIIVYMILLVLAILKGLFDIFSLVGTWQMLFFVFNLIFFGFACFFVFLANRNYRHSVKDNAKQSLLEKRAQELARKME